MAANASGATLKPAHIDTVVQDYMDHLLADLFPEVPDDVVHANKTMAQKRAAGEVISQKSTAVSVQSEAMQPVITQQVKQVSTLSQPSTDLDDAPIQNKVHTDIKPIPAQPITAQPISDPVNTQAPIAAELKPPSSVVETKNDPLAQSAVKAQATEPAEKRFPQAPDWAQQAFDVLLFDVCGLKLAVPMEALGRIIKVEQDLNHLIGRPDWFMGAYNDSAHAEQEGEAGNQHLYVVDTAKYIMPEKGFDLATQGFSYVIQLQRSRWTLACKQVYSTVRLEPDHVKWRSQKGLRQWLAGTVIEHMCALIHVDALVELLQLHEQKGAGQ